MNITAQRELLLQQEKIKDWERQMAAQARTMPLTQSEQYGADLSRISRQRQAVQKNSPWAGYERPTDAELNQRFPIPENPIQAEIKSELAKNPIGSLPQPEWPIQPPSGLINSFSQEQPQWPVDVPQELVKTGGAGGGFRDSNIQDATGLTGGGALMNGGAGGGQRDSNIQDATGTTGGNAGSADASKKGFDWDGLSSGFSALGKGMKGMQSGGVADMRPPSLMDDTGSRMAAASQLWSSVMSKRKMKGLI